MEEYAVDEEAHGIDEPYTEVMDIGTVTYQYNEGVKPITKNVMEYVALVEADSIVYFLPTCPPEWLPMVGEYVTAGCSRRMPEGIMGRVMAVEDRDGLIKVTTTHCTTNEVFRELSFEIDFDYQTPYIECTDSATLDSLGIARTDSVVYDFALVEQGAATRAFTRSTRADDEKEDPNKGTGGGDAPTDSSYVWELKFEQKMKAGITAYMNGKVTTTDRRTIHYKSDEKEKIYEKWTIDHSYKDYELEFGISKSGRPVGFDPAGFRNKAEKKEYIKMMKELAKQQGKKHFKPEIKDLKIPLPTTYPCYIVLSFSVGIDVTVSGFGAKKWREYLPEVKTGEIKKNGEKRTVKADHKTDNSLRAGYCTDITSSYVGKAVITASARVGVGIEFAGGLGVSIGAKLESTLTIGKEFHPEYYLSDTSEIYHEDLLLETSINFIVDINWYLTPLGMPFLSFTKELYNKQIYHDVLNDGPVLTDVKLDHYKKKPDMSIEFTPTFTYKKLGSFLSKTTKQCYPRLRVYDMDHKQFFDVTRSGTNEQRVIYDGKALNFSFTSNEVKEKLGQNDVTGYRFIVVPTYYNADDDLTTELRDYEQTVGEGGPKCETTMLKQMFAGEVQYLKDPATVLARMGFNSMEDWMQHYTVYSAKAQFKLENTLNIDSWGFHVEIYKMRTKEVLKSKDYIVADKSKGQSITRGTYTFRLEFLSNISEMNYAMGEYYADQLRLRVCPFAVVNGNHVEFKAWKQLLLESVKEGDESLGSEENPVNI